MKKTNNLLTILTLALAMVLIIACGEETGVNNGTEHPSDTTAVATSSSGVAKDSSSSANGTSSSSQSGNSSGGAVSSSSQTGTSSSSSSSSSKKAPPAPSSSSTCVDGEEKILKGSGIKLVCVDGEFKDPLEGTYGPDDTIKSPYYDMDNVFAKWEDNRAVYSEFTDPRDGQTYKTVVVRVSTVGDISEYREYFAQNLNYGTQVMLKEGQAQTAGTKYCYDDDPLHCKHHLGGLYTWSNAMGLPAACDTVAVGSENCPKDGMLSRGAIRQGICPEGWHVMNQNDFSLALLATGSVSTVQSRAWPQSIPADNMSGFSALPGGALIIQSI